MSIKGENIYKRKDQRWEARYVRGHREDGSIHYGYCYGKTYREAKQKLTLAKQSMASCQSKIPVDQITLSQASEEWLRLCRNRVKESSFVKYTGTVKHYIDPGLGSYTLKSLNTRLLESFSDCLLHQNGLSPKTVRDILSTLHSILRYAAAQWPESVPGLVIPYPRNER